MLKNLSIKNLVPGLVERGKIKIGIKGKWVKSQGPQGREFQIPQKLDHFVVTSMLRDPKTNNFMLDNQIMEMLGADPTEIPIRLLYDDIELNFQTRYGCYVGNQLFCYGDGETAQELKQDGSRAAVSCTCERQDPLYGKRDKCKVNGTLSVIIDRADVVGGVWKFRTTSFNSVVNLLGSLTLIKRIAGCLAGLPLNMTLAPKTVANPINQKMQTVYVVGVEFRGTVQKLRDNGLALALANAKHDIAIKDIEGEAKRLLSGAAGAFDADGGSEIEAEFYPDDAAAQKPEKEKPDPAQPPVKNQPADTPAEETPDLSQPGAEPAQPPPQPPEKPKRGRRKVARGAQAPAKTAQPDPPPAQPPAQESPAAPAAGSQAQADSQPLDLF